MAQVPYNNVQDVLPDARPPDDYLHVQASPADFGGAIGQGLEQLGKGTTATAQHWGEIQVDSLTNGYQRQANDLVENFKKLRGADALNAQDSVKQQLYDMYDKTRGQLQTADQIQSFDRNNRPYTDRYLVGNINTHANDQAQQFKKQTNNDGILNANALAANAGASGNEAFAVVQYHKSVEFNNKQLALDGQENDPEAKKSAVLRAGSTLKSYFEALSVNNPQKAYKDVDRFQSELGPLWAPLKEQLKGRADQQSVDSKSAEYDNKIASGAVQPVRPTLAAAVGDSTADGVKSAGGLTGDTRVGRPSRAVTASIRDLPTATVAGTPLVIGTGVMNDAGPNADLSKVDLAVVTDQIETAKAKGYKPVILGVGDKYAALNPKIQKLAEQNGAQFLPLGPNDGTHPTGDSYKKLATSVGGAQAQQQRPVTPVSGDALFNAFHGQESGGGANTSTSVDNAHGDMQIIPSTFAKFAKPGENINNPADNKAVGRRILDYYSQKYSGDAARVAVAYFSGEGNVAPPGSATPWIENRHDGQGAFVSQYVNGILGRLKQPGIAAVAPPLGHGSLTASGTIARPGWEDAPGPDEETKTTPPPEPPIDQAAFTPPTAPQPLTPQDILATKVNMIRHDPDTTPEMKVKLEEKAQQAFHYALIALEQDKAAKSANLQRASNDYYAAINKKDASAYQQLLVDPRFNDNEEARDVIKRRFQEIGVGDKRDFGSGYMDALNRLVLPENDPNRLSSNVEVMKLKLQGKINDAGEKQLFEELDKARSGKFDYGLQSVVNAALAQDKKWFEYDNPEIKLKNDIGEEKFNKEYLGAWYRGLNEWVSEGKNPMDYPPLKDPKEAQKLKDRIWPEGEKREYYSKRIAAELGAPADLPPAPEGTNAVYWSTLVGNPPMMAGGKPMDQVKWAEVIKNLAMNPTQDYADRLDSWLKNTGIRAKDVLDRLGVKNNLAGPAPDKTLNLAPDTSIKGD